MHGVIAGIGVVLAAAAAVYSSLAWLVLRRWLEAPAPPAGERPPVSVLKPLCGAEAQLPDCLRSLARQSYPGLQIVFGVRESLDPAIAVVQQLQHDGLNRNIQRRSRLVQSEKPWPTGDRTRDPDAGLLPAGKLVRETRQ